MKKLFVAIGLFISIHAHTQPYLSINATTKGVGFSAGFLDASSGIEFFTGYNVPIIRTDIPRLFILSAGKRILLSQRESDNFTLTPSVGYGVYSIKTRSDLAIHKEDNTVTKKTYGKPALGLELGKDCYLGRAFVNLNYCGLVYAGIGIRAFIK